MQKEATNQVKKKPRLFLRKQTTNLNIAEGVTLVEGVQIIELDTRLKKRIIQKKTEKEQKIKS